MRSKLTSVDNVFIEIFSVTKRYLDNVHNVILYKCLKFSGLEKSLNNNKEARLFQH